MKILKYIVLTIVSATLINTSFGQDNLKLKVIEFMKEYEKYASFTTDDLSYESAYEVNFKKDLFVTSKNNLTDDLKALQVFNDIGEENKPPYISTQEYINKTSKKYPKGIDININIKEIGTSKEIRNNTFETDVTVLKKLFALNKNEKIDQKEFTLIFRIQYQKTNGEIKNMKIYTITAKRFPRKPSGLYLGINFQPGLTGIGTKDFLNENNIYGNWSQNSEFSFSGGLELNYYFDNPMFGFGARINYSIYKSSFSLDSIKQGDVGSIDIDEDEFYLRASGSSYNETASLSFFDIPLFLKLKFDMNNIKILNHIYLNVGPVFSFGISKTVNTDGNYTFTGYYPDYHVLLYDIPEYNYSTYDSISSSPQSNTKSFNLSGLIEFGINLPIISDKLNLNIAILYQQGFLNLSTGDEDYALTLGYNKYNPILDSRSKVSTSFFGVNIGLLYKIF